MRQWLYRCARAVATLWIVAMAAWACLEAAPGTPAESAAHAMGVLPEDPGALAPELRAKLIQAAARPHGLDRPVHVRFANFAWRIVRLDLGRSYRDGRPVAARLARTLSLTAALVLAATGIAYLVGTGVALGCAAKPGGWIDFVASAVGALVIALPVAWLSILALHSLAGGNPWRFFPPGGGSLASLVLPVGILSCVATAVVLRHARCALIMTRMQPAAMGARARGASELRVLLVHALGMAASSLVGLLAVLAPYLLGASLVVERAFDLDGLGALLVQASAIHDAPIVLGGTLAMGAFVITSSLAADLLATRVDPRLGDR
ncbi:MAG: ABC transporter permease [Deltaproteobacteria bacterium]|nr:ABC transporter permease [Deltaproteobacteria bacterium]